LLEKNASVIRERILRFVPFQVETFHRKWEQLIQEDLYRLYPRYYDHVVQLDIESNKTVSDGLKDDRPSSSSSSINMMMTDVTLKHVKEATTILSKERLVFIDDTLLDKALTECPLDVNNEKLIMRRDVIISEDIVAQKLMEKEDCDVCLSASTMWTLFNNNSKSFGSEESKIKKAFMIPMKIRNKNNKKRIFLDKVLSKNEMNSRQKMEFFCTKQLMAFFYNDTVHQHHHQATAVATAFTTADIIADATKAEAKAKAKEVASDAETSVKKQHQQQKNVVLSFLPEEKSYHVWTLGEKKVLIRCKNNATTTSLKKLKSPLPPPPSTATIPACILTKIDYQELGLSERITQEDRRKWWLNAWLRGNAEIFVAVINPFSFPQEYKYKNKNENPSDAHSFTKVTKSDNKKKQILRWEKHTLASIVYGSNQSQSNLKEDFSNHTECFEPMESFCLVDRVFSLAYELPVGDYLIEYAPLTNVIQILQASDQKLSDNSTCTTTTGNGATSGTTTSTMDLYAIFNQEHSSRKTTSEMVAQLGYIPPKWIYPKGLMPQYALERIPYTFRTGTYCAAFARDGTCPRLAQQQPCIDIHLRPSMNPLNASSTCPFVWKFLLFDQQLLKASSGIACWSLVPIKAGTNMSEQKKKKQPKGSIKPTTILPHFLFCQDPNRNPFTDQPCFVSTSATMNKNDSKMTTVDSTGSSTRDNNTTCHLRHLTLHQVMERIADDYLRHERLQRRKTKKNNRQKNKNKNYS
jgi:hypothetical protein